MGRREYILNMYIYIYIYILNIWVSQVGFGGFGIL